MSPKKSKKKNPGRPFLSNKFEPLIHLNDNAVKNDQANTKKIKIPPIVIKNQKYNDILKFVSSLNIVKYHIQFISIGIKVIVQCLDDFDNLQKYLSDKNINYFTYSMPHKLPFKTVLSGLPTLNTNDIKSELMELLPKNIVC